MPGFQTCLLGQQTYIKNCNFVLASKSPRRKEIFELMGISENLQIIPSQFEENLDKNQFKNPGEYASMTAQSKAAEVAETQFKLHSASKSVRPMVVIGADTIVEIDGEILEKPEDKNHAFEMLSSLSGKIHLVHTGVAIFTSTHGSQAPASSWYHTTAVEMLNLHENDLWAYVDSGEPMDKAGAYGIQGLGGQLVKGISGCYFNVMGFPMSKFSCVLTELIEKEQK
eukprot:CAMPEP_0171471230 /NCGR_PEP_ID=MMETSP0946-20130122/581_1 /TAXON_ID=109269 /ORGANISM="Vaucheria litorea, Strain CCMP2940" /LENGTH=225 /DNA_ID=CAMNT_0012000681 /DNA_START=136 /DNA_END=813 /DNA_ORIENTATION=-